MHHGGKQRWRVFGDWKILAFFPVADRRQFSNVTGRRAYRNRDANAIFSALTRQLILSGALLLAPATLAAGFCQYLTDIFFATRQATETKKPDEPDVYRSNDTVESYVLPPLDRSQFWPAPDSVKIPEPPPIDAVALTEAQQQTIRDYSATIGVNANTTIRTGRSVEGMSINSAKLHVQAFDSAISAFPSYVGTVYRKFNIYNPTQILSTYRLGAIVTEPTPTSTSKTPDAHIVTEYGSTYPNVWMVIESKRGKDISRFGIPGEHEVAFPSSTKFLVLDVKHSSNEVYVRLAEID